MLLRNTWFKEIFVFWCYIRIILSNVITFLFYRFINLYTRTSMKLIAMHTKAWKISYSINIYISVWWGKDINHLLSGVRIIAVVDAYIYISRVGRFYWFFTCWIPINKQKINTSVRNKNIILPQFYQ